MRAVPHGGGEGNLHLLSARERTEPEMSTKLTVETDVLEMPLDIGGSQRHRKSRGAGRNLLIDSLAGLGPTTLLELVEAEPRRKSRRLTLPLDLILVVVLRTLLEAALTSKLLNNKLGAVLLQVLGHPLVVDGDLHELELLVTDHHGSLLEGLTILAVGITPADVLVRSLLQVVLDVMEGMLGDVPNTAIGMLPHGSRVGFELTSKQLDNGGLSGTVGTDASHTRGERAADSNTGNLRAAGRRVGEDDIVHLDDGFALAGNTLQISRFREAEFQGGSLELKVGLGLGDLLHKLSQVTLEEPELEVLNLDDVRAHTLQEPTVVRHDNARHVLEIIEVVLDPLHVDNIQMIRRFIEQKDISLLEHSAGDGELHTPATRQVRDGALEHELGESDR